MLLFSHSKHNMIHFSLESVRWKGSKTTQDVLFGISLKVTRTSGPPAIKVACLWCINEGELCFSGGAIL